MFAVPGWNLSAPLKAESEAAASAAANSKKRKRQGKKGGDKDDDGKGQVPSVTKENVADMWAEVVEGTSKSKEKEAGEKKMRSQKQEYKAAQKLEMQAKQKLEKEKEGKPPKSKKQRREEDAAAGSKKEGERMEEGDATKGHDASKQETAAKGKKQKKKDTKQRNAPDTTTTAATVTAAPCPLPSANNAKLTPLQAKMREKLASARFRHLNQTLYTTPSAHSLQLIEDDPQIFNEYHAGFRQQVAVWPENPVDTFVQLVQRRGAVRGDARKKASNKNAEGEGDEGDSTASKALKPLPRDFRTHVCTMADLGCGDATLSASLQPSLRKLKLAIHSFDLAAPSPLITKADISALPLRDGAVDVAIFCLALMGTNWPDFIDEAYRVLRWKGELWVAEIKSRFGRVAGAKDANKVVDHSVGRRQKSAAARHNKANKEAADAAAADDEALAVEIDGAAPQRANETDVSAFVNALRARGFVLDAESAAPVDLRNKMFVRMQFVKAAAPSKGKNVRRGREAAGGGMGKARAKKFVEEEAAEGEVDEAALLKPCVYKLR
ncbi:methyltransferase-domain-containing protein [Phyllosticta citrichinensis]|uniref:Ribosomal RNA-processing protein 8 n=1 Tax=Phyllosticta citrichinensis TaxID=1130410 RepID=A0ABR1XLN6_9PEZI